MRAIASRRVRHRAEMRCRKPNRPCRDGDDPYISPAVTTIICPMNQRPLILISLVCLLGVSGCSMLESSDKSIIQQAQGFDQGIKAAEIQNTDVNGYLSRIGDRILAAAKQSDAAHWGPPSHF